jgi:hypothetical protein
MPENANQHYVPQFYFKLFNGGKRHICVLLTKEGRIIPAAPVKGQCARHTFYGSVEIEKMFSHLEGRHAPTLRALVEMATTSDLTSFSDDNWPWVLNAVVIQHARTLLEVEKEMPAMIAMQLHMFKEHLRQLPDEDGKEVLGAIERGEIELTEDPTATVLKQIQSALNSSMLLMDMQASILRNHTDYPFIFSDSPVVFYNSYYKRITERGVLGLQTPGLLVFFPLTPRFQLMLFDPAVYTGSCRNGLFCEVRSRSDVSQLNALQLHHSRMAVYFARQDDADYVTELYRMHKPRLVKPETQFRVRRDWLVDGKPCEDQILQIFERQLNHDLSLSFMSCNRISPREFVFRRRTPWVVAMHKRLFPTG